jgi:PAS domain S-box-containing protein
MDKKVQEQEFQILTSQLARLEHEMKKYDLLWQTAGFAILTLHKYVFIDCNVMAEKIFGLSKEEIIGKEPFILSPKYQPDGMSSQEKAMELIDKTLSGESTNFVWEHVRGDGSRFYADISLNKIEISDEEYVQVILKDISKEKLSKERLENQNKIIRHLNRKYQRQNEDYEKLLDQLGSHQELTNDILSTINDGVAVFYPDKFLYLNDQLLYMLGKSERDFSPEDMFGLLGVSFGDIKLSYENKQGFQLWLQRNTNDKYYRLQISVMSNQNLLMAHLTDYTEIKKAQENVEKSEYKFRSIFHSSTDGIILVGENFTVLETNQTFELKYNYTAADLIGVNVETLFYNDKAEGFTNWIMSNTGESMDLAEFEVFTAGGESSPVEIGSRKVILGNKFMYLLIVRDISYRKGFEQQLLNKTIEAEEEERKRIAANLHDELGPILSSLKLYNNSLKSKQEGNEQLAFLSEQFDKLISEAVDTVRFLSEDLSPVTLYKGGLSKAIKKRLDAISEFYEIIYESHLGDVRFLEQIEINIYRMINEFINNTIKHADATLIKVKIVRAKSGLSIHYSDNGKGVEGELIELSQAGRGIANIMGRLKSLNASIKLISEKGMGVNYDILIPFVERDD